MRALYFGTYDRTYPRNAQVISCLRGAGVEVVEKHREVWGRHNWSLGGRQLLRVLGAEIRLAVSRTDADVVIVGYPGQFDFPAARLTARGRPIVFNPLVSLHDTLVTDRARFRGGGTAAGILRTMDRSAFRHATLVVADTHAHARFFAESFGVEDERLGVAFVGAEDRLFRPAQARERRFCALFIGKLVPLQGIETILEAARLAPEIAFRIIGEGQLSGAVEARPVNVAYLPWVEYDTLPGEYQRAGCALGIFGVRAQGRPRDPQQGLSGAGLCGAAGDGRHSGHAGAPA